MSGTSPVSGGDRLAQAMALHRAGDLGAALAAYRRHLQDRPGDVEAWCLLAGAEGQSGNHAGARSAYRRGVEAAPGHAPAHAGLGTSSLHLGDFAGAVEHFRRALELDPALTDARLQLAMALRRLARLEEAIAALEAVLEREPEHAQARFNLGMASLEAGRPDRAEDAFRRVLSARPGFVPALVGLGRALQSRNRLDEARETLDEAGAAAPEDPAVAMARAGLLTATGRVTEARSEYEKALAARPRDAGACLGLAELDRLAGAPERGIARLEPLLRTSPPGGVLVSLARLLRAAGRPTDAEGLAREQLASDRLMPRVRLALLRELGHALDETGDADGAWAAWTEANAPRAGRFDPDDFDRAIDALIRSFDPALIERAAVATESPATGPQPLLLVGPPRAGKSILEQMLACHPAVHGAGELRMLGELVNAVQQLGGAEAYPGCVAALGAGDLATLAADYRAALAAAAAGRRWVVDTQPTNFLHVGLAALLHPGVRVVWCRRDPVDLAWACYARGFADGAFDFAASADGIGRYLAALDRLFEHWRRLLPGAVAGVDYETLVTAPEDTVGGVLDWLGLGGHPDCAESHRPGRASLAAPPALSGPLHAGEVGRGGPYASRFAGLPPAADRG